VVEDEVQRYRADKAIKETWKTQGRMLVCIGPDPGAEHVVRSAARLAGQLDEDWTAVYVETPELQRLHAAERGRILAVVSLAEQLGAGTAILTGNDVAEAIVEYARDHNISTIVLGRGGSAALPFQASVYEAISKAGAALDLIEIGRGDAGTAVAAPALVAEGPSPRRGEKRLRYLWTALVCLGVTALMVALARNFDLANVAMLYMLVVVLVGVQWGRGPSIVAAIANVLASTSSSCRPSSRSSLPTSSITSPTR
jgi:two-component system sensor histidine kinase KdpD